MITAAQRAKEARSSALNLLARREHGFNELARKLAVRFPREAVMPALEQLRTEGLQNDERFVESYVYRCYQRGVGPTRIKYELLQKGIASELVAHYVHEQVEQWGQLAREVKERKYGSEPAQNKKERARQTRFLAQRGFTMGQIYSALS